MLWFKVQVCLTLERRGFRVKRKRLRKGRIGNSHQIKKEDAVEFFKSQFKVVISEEE